MILLFLGLGLWAILLVQAINFRFRRSETRAVGAPCMWCYPEPCSCPWNKGAVRHVQPIPRPDPSRPAPGDPERVPYGFRLPPWPSSPDELRSPLPVRRQIKRQNAAALRVGGQARKPRAPMPPKDEGRPQAPPPKFVVERSDSYRNIEDDGREHRRPPMKGADEARRMFEEVAEKHKQQIIASQSIPPPAIRRAHR